MKYPYIVFADGMEICPVFENLKGDPFLVDLSVAKERLDKMNIWDQKAFQDWLDREMKDRYFWGCASYLENRETILSRLPQMREEKRWFHLGLDIIVPLHTPLHAPLDGVVQESAYEAGEGNFGGHVLLRHDSHRFDTFYSLYGHLNRESLPARGSVFKAGDAFARIGDFHENGYWFYHTHLQILTQKGYEGGWISKGYCSAADLASIDHLCPSPLLLFRR